MFAKDSSTTYRNRLETETAVPVISCAQLLTEHDNNKFEFAGIARSQSVRDYDDIQNGMKRDDHFTLAYGGKVTLLNQSNGPINRGDRIEWTFMDDQAGPPLNKKQKTGPRRIILRKAGDDPSRIIGRALSNARRSENFDLLLQPY